MNSEAKKDMRWDLGILYSGISDPELERDMEDFAAKAKAFSAAHKGRLAETLGRAIADYAELEMLSGKIMTYLFLRQSTDVQDAAVKAKSAEAQRKLSAIQGEHLTFFELELAAMDEAAVGKFYAGDETARKHRPWIEHVRLFRPHFLIEPVESALAKRSPFGPAAWSEFFDEAENDLAFDRGGKKNLTEMLHILTESKDAGERAQVLAEINGGLGGFFAKYSAQTLYVTAGRQAVEDGDRGYAHPMDFRNKMSRIPDEVVETLHRSVMEAGAPLVRRYYKLKARHLGLPVLKWSDRNAPMPFADTSAVPYEEAIKIVEEAYASFSPTLAGIIRTFSDEGRIDVPATKTKRGGAFNASLILPGGRPASFTFLNYLGSNRDVMTLAHELGHGVHGILAGEAQGPLMLHAPTAYAETASVFGEMVAFRFLSDRLAQKGDEKARLALLMGKIDDSMNTVIRQIGFSNFERRLHGMDASYSKWEKPKKFSAEELDAIWLRTVRELYGEEGDVFTYENADRLWSYVGHFHRPFYVYGYAFGELLTQSLFAQKERLAEKFEPLYLDLLRSGSTKNAIELLEPFGLDPRDPEFWAEGLRKGMGAWIAEAEKLSEHAGA